MRSPTSHPGPGEVGALGGEHELPEVWTEWAFPWGSCWGLAGGVASARRGGVQSDELRWRAVAALFRPSGLPMGSASLWLSAGLCARFRGLAQHTGVGNAPCRGPWELSKT